MTILALAVCSLNASASTPKKRGILSCTEALTVYSQTKADDLVEILVQRFVKKGFLEEPSRRLLREIENQKVRVFDFGDKNLTSYLTKLGVRERDILGIQLKGAMLVTRGMFLSEDVLKSRGANSSDPDLASVIIIQGLAGTEADAIFEEVFHLRIFRFMRDLSDETALVSQSRDFSRAVDEFIAKQLVLSARETSNETRVGLVKKMFRLYGIDETAKELFLKSLFAIGSKAGTDFENISLHVLARKLMMITFEDVNGMRDDSADWMRFRERFK